MTTIHSTPRNTHFCVLLDRSGSMEAIRTDVVGGFNAFLAEQASAGDDARMTLVQFDGQDPNEVIVDHKRLGRVSSLTLGTFVPRGNTPLLDATAEIIDRAARRERRRARAGKPAEEIVVVTITDGQENASRRWTRDAVKNLISQKEREGWTFVFLSADLNAYDDAAALGYDVRSVQAWAPTPAGAAAAFKDVSRAARSRREKVVACAPYDKDDFFEGQKEAEKLI